MYSMQAVVRKSINNATMQFEKLGYVANNLANYNTAAYKTSRFEQILREDGYIDGAIRTNALQGSIRISKNLMISQLKAKVIFLLFQKMARFNTQEMVH